MIGPGRGNVPISARRNTAEYLDVGAGQQHREAIMTYAIPTVERRPAWARPALGAGCAALAILAVLTASTAQAGIAYIGGVGETVYGVTAYGGAPQGAPNFLLTNNVTGFNDILTSPGGGFLTANPVVAANIAQTGIQPLGLYSFKIGGGNGNGPFGAGQTLVTGPRVGFTLRDAAPGGGSASYSITSWTTNYLITAGGFAGDLGTYLSIGGRLPAVNSAVATSLVSNYYLNGVYVGQTTPLILAAAGNGNFQALGGNGAGLVFGGGGTFRGLAIDNVLSALAAGNTIKVVSTLTAYADPASLDAIAPDISLIQGATLPTSISDVSGGVPEPASWALMLIGVGAMGVSLRRRRGAAEAPRVA
jgi:hypothetical protein